MCSVHQCLEVDVNVVWVMCGGLSLRCFPRLLTLSRGDPCRVFCRARGDCVRPEGARVKSRARDSCSWGRLYSGVSVYQTHHVLDCCRESQAGRALWGLGQKNRVQGVVSVLVVSVFCALVSAKGPGARRGWLFVMFMLLG